MQLGFDTKLDPAVGMAAVASTVALFLHLHLPTPTLPLVPEALQHGSAASGLQQGCAAASASADKPKQQLGQQNGAAAAPETGMQHSDSGWSLVSAGDAGSGAPAGSQNAKLSGSAGAGTNGADGFAPEGPSEATRTAAASVQRALDPAAGAEEQASEERGGVQTAVRTPQGGAFLPSSTELRSISGNAKSKHGVGAAANKGGSGNTGAAQMRQAAGQAQQVAVSVCTCTAVAQLLGKLAAVLELYAPAGRAPAEDDGA